MDTNILRYVHDPRDPVRQTTAGSLLQSQTSCSEPLNKFSSTQWRARATLVVLTAQ